MIGRQPALLRRWWQFSLPLSNRRGHCRVQRSSFLFLLFNELLSSSMECPVLEQCCLVLWIWVLNFILNFLDQCPGNTIFPSRGNSELTTGRSERWRRLGQARWGKTRKNCYCLIVWNCTKSHYYSSWCFLCHVKEFLYFLKYRAVSLLGLLLNNF